MKRDEHECLNCGRTWSIRDGECIRCRWKVVDPVETCPKCETDLARLALFEALAAVAEEAKTASTGPNTWFRVLNRLAALAQKGAM